MQKFLYIPITMLHYLWQLVQPMLHPTYLSKDFW
jgi:hypothetical protein